VPEGTGVGAACLAPFLLAAPVSAGCPRAPALRAAPGAILARLGRGRVNGASIVRCAVDAQDAVAAATTVRDSVARVTARGCLPIVLGGDHSVAAGAIAGVHDGLRARCGRDVPLFVLWLDAHPDVNTAATSPSGNLHGMVLSGLLGEGPLAVDEPLPPERVVLAGARSFDPGEPAFLQARPQISMWDVGHLRGDGWRAPLDALLRRVAARGGRLYVSVDLDVFDPAVAPGVVAPAPGGALAEPVVELLRAARRSGRLAGADVVELYPPLDHGPTAALAARVVEALADAGGRSTGDAEGGVRERHLGSVAAS
jgi:arginase